MPGQYTPLSPVHSQPFLSATVASLSVTASLDTMAAASLSQPDLGQATSSLHGSGVAGGLPSQLSAGAHAAAVTPIMEEMQSLHALCMYTCTVHVRERVCVGGIYAE